MLARDASRVVCVNFPCRKRALRGLLQQCVEFVAHENGTKEGASVLQK